MKLLNLNTLEICGSYANLMDWKNIIIVYFF